MNGYLKGGLTSVPPIILKINSEFELNKVTRAGEIVKLAEYLS
jgi:hypothetical protein